MALERRIALITGASGTLGHAIARCLAARGLMVWAHASAHIERAQGLADEIRGRGGQAKAVAFDVTDADETAGKLAELIEQDGPIQVVVNNAGIYDDGPLAGMAAEQWHRVIDVSLHGFYNVTRPLLLPRLPM